MRRILTDISMEQRQLVSAKMNVLSAAPIMMRSSDRWYLWPIESEQGSASWTRRVPGVVDVQEQEKKDT